MGKVYNILILCILVIPSSFASGQDKGVKTQVLNFEDELVEGRDVKPDLFFLLQQRKFNYSRLIRLREHFIPEAREAEGKFRFRKDAK